MGKGDWTRGSESYLLSLPLSSPFLGPPPSPFRVQLDNPGSFPHFKILNLITPTKSLLSAKGTETQVLGIGASLFGAILQPQSCPQLFLPTPSVHTPLLPSMGRCFPFLEPGLALVCSDRQDVITVTLPQSGAWL